MSGNNVNNVNGNNDNFKGSMSPPNFNLSPTLDIGGLYQNTAPVPKDGLFEDNSSGVSNSSVEVPTEVANDAGVIVAHQNYDGSVATSNDANAAETEAIAEDAKAEKKLTDCNSVEADAEANLQTQKGVLGVITNMYEAACSVLRSLFSNKAAVESGEADAWSQVVKGLDVEKQEQQEVVNQADEQHDTAKQNTKTSEDNKATTEEVKEEATETAEEAGQDVVEKKEILEAEIQRAQEDTSGTVPQGGEQTVPEEISETVPQEGGQPVPEDTSGTVPQGGEQTVPEDTSGTETATTGVAGDGVNGSQSEVDNTLAEKMKVTEAAVDEAAVPMNAVTKDENAMFEEATGLDKTQIIEKVASGEISLIDVVKEVSKVAKKEQVAQTYAKGGSIAKTENVSIEEHAETESELVDTILGVSNIVESGDVEFVNMTDESNYKAGMRIVDRVNSGEYIKTDTLNEHLGNADNIELVESSTVNDTQYEEYSNAILDQLQKSISNEQGSELNDQTFNAIKSEFEFKAATSPEDAFKFLEDEARKHGIDKAIEST